MFALRSLSLLVLAPTLLSSQSSVRFDGSPTALGDAGGDGAVGIDDLTIDDHAERARNTYDATEIDVSGILAAYGLQDEFLPNGIVTGEFMLTSPPLDEAATQRRVIRGSGGLSLYLVHRGSDRPVALDLQHWGPVQQTFRVREGATVLASSEGLDVFAGLPGMSVRKVRAITPADGSSVPWLVVACSVLLKVQQFDSADEAFLKESQNNRLLKWSVTLKRYVDATDELFVSTAGVQELNTCGLAVGHLNGDAYEDIVLGHYSNSFWGEQNEVLLGRADGTFMRMWTNPFRVGTLALRDGTADIEIADLDDDGWQDIVVANRWFDAPSYNMTANDSARNYVLWGRGPGLIQQQGAPIQPSFTRPRFLDADAAASEDTVALDVADADLDGRIDIVFGNHGKTEAPFHDPEGQNDVVFEHASARTFVEHELPNTGGSQQTTDIAFVDVGKPINRGLESGSPFPNPFASPGVWDFNLKPVDSDYTNGVDAGAPWQGADVLDGRPEIARCYRAARWHGLRWWLNDPERSFNWYYDPNQSTPVKVNLPPLDYTWDFVHLDGSQASQNSQGPWSDSSFANVPDSYNLKSLLRLYRTRLAAFPQVLLFGDFFDDYLAEDSLPVNDNDPHGNPHLFLGMGYELGGVPNRLVPFATDSNIPDIDGEQYIGVVEPSIANSATWTGGWTEGTGKGYGGGFCDVNTDGKIDLIRSERSNAHLYINQDPEGTFKRETDPLKWPFPDTVFAHTRFFREDSVAADFDEDGDLDVFSVGFAGMQDYSEGHARGEQGDEDVNGDVWMEPSLSAQELERMYQDAIFLENVAGNMAMRSDRLDPNGRFLNGQGSDRGTEGDFDGDGDLDVLTVQWPTDKPNVFGGGANPDPNDPDLALWLAPFAFDGLTEKKALGFRLWINVIDEGGTTWFQDRADDWIGGYDSNSDWHYGPEDAYGGVGFTSGTTYSELNDRNFRSAAVGDFDRDGFLDFYTAYTDSGGSAHGHNLFLNRPQNQGRVLEDYTHHQLVNNQRVLPLYSGSAVAGTSTSQCVNAFDADLDGDLDLALALGTGHHSTLLRNVLGPGTGGQLVFQTVQFDTWNPDWLDEFQSAAGSPDNTSWMQQVDADLDGDLDLVEFTGWTGHRLFQNGERGVLGVFKDVSADPLAAATHVTSTSAISIHRGALPQDVQVADLNGDKLPDLWADYTTRPATAYFNVAATHPNVPPAGTPSISIVFPETGVVEGETFRVYGTDLQSVDRIELVLGAASNPTIVSLTGANVVTYAHGRFVDGVMPPSTSYGPAGIQVHKPGASSPVYRDRNFAVLMAN